MPADRTSDQSDAGRSKIRPIEHQTNRMPDQSNAGRSKIGPIERQTNRTPDQSGVFLVAAPRASASSVPVYWG
eukprot:3189170-Pyramimonas_sp.AAC.2